MVLWIDDKAKTQMAQASAMFSIFGRLGSMAMRNYILHYHIAVWSSFIFCRSVVCSCFGNQMSKYGHAYSVLGE